MGGAPRCSLGSSGSNSGRGWSSRDQRMEQQGPMLVGSGVGTELETSLTPEGLLMTTTHKIHLPPAHTVPPTISQVWVTGRIRPLNPFSSPSHSITCLGLAHAFSCSQGRWQPGAKPPSTVERAWSHCWPALWLKVSS